MLAALRTYYGTFAAATPIVYGRQAASFPPRLKEPCILTAGRVWDGAQNVAALEQVAARLSWPVFVAAEAHPPESGEVCFRHVQCLGQLAPADLAVWQGSAAIFALPARYESCGLAALEAGLAGCALVLGDIPSLREVWGDAAVFVPPDQPDTLTAVLQHLITDANWRGLMAQRTHVCALRYTLERMAREYVALYARLMRLRTPVRLVS